MSNETLTIREAELSLRMDGNRLVGDAIVYGKRSRPINEGGKTFTEVIEPGALDLSGNVKFNYRHQDVAEYGDTASGNLTLNNTARALEFNLDLPSYATTLRELVAQKKVRGMSVGMKIVEQTIDSDGLHRVKRALLDHIAITPIPAYPQTSVTLRERKALYAKMRHDLLRKLLP